MQLTHTMNDVQILYIECLNLFGQIVVIRTLASLEIGKILGFAGIGCAVLIAVNVFFVPRFGYMACAWAGFAGYAVSMTLSYIVGQRLHPIPYPMQQIAYYIILALVSWLSMGYFAEHLPQWGSLLYNTLVIIFFVTIIVRQDFPLSNLPVVGKYFRH